MGDLRIRREPTFTSMRKLREGWMNPPFMLLIVAAAAVAVAALPSDVPRTEEAIQPVTELPTSDSGNFQVPLNRKGANVFVDDSHGFDELFEDTAKQTKQDVSVEKDSQNDAVEFASQTEALDKKAGAKAFMDAFAALDRAADKVESKDPHSIVQEGRTNSLVERNVKTSSPYRFSPGPPPSYPISDYSARLAARLATDKLTAATTNSAFERYKKNPFALKVVGKGKTAKLLLQNPSAFAKRLKEIPKKGRAKWACTAAGRAMKGTYNSAMKFWNGQGHQVYAKVCSVTGTPCKASAKLSAPYTFAPVSSREVPLTVINTWITHPGCKSSHKIHHALKKSGAAVSTGSLTVLGMALISVWWVYRA